METENLTDDAPDLAGIAAAGDRVDKAGDFDPGADTAGQAREGDYIPGQVTDEQRFTAAIAVDVVQVLLAMVSRRQGGDGFEFTDDEKTQLIEAGAGVVAVSGGEMPAWLQPYRPHIKLVTVIGGVALGRAMAKAAEAEADREAGSGAES